MFGIEAKIIAVMVAIGLLVSGYFYVLDKGGDIREAAIVAQQAIKDKEQQAKYNLVAQEYETLKIKRQENAKVITKTVEKIITRDVYRNVCFDSDGLSVANQALSGGDSSSVNATMPSTK